MLETAPRASRRRKRFALRLTSLFILCSALPVFAFSGLAYFSTRAQLEQDAEQALRRDAKAAAMSVFERLAIGEARLRALGPEIDESDDGGGRYFSAVELSPFDEAQLTDRERARLADGGSILAVVDAEGGASIRMLRVWEGEILTAVYTPEFLFTPDRVAASEGYWVADATGRLIFGVTPDVEGIASPMSRAPVTGSGVRGMFAVSGPQGAAFGVVWPLFLRSPYELSGLQVGYSRLRESVHLPLRDFSRIFYATMVVTLLASAAMATWQIRVRVGPLARLSATARQIAEGELSARARIDSDDEFETLGDAFDTMADRLQRHFESVMNLRLTAESLLSSTTNQDVANVVIPAVGEVARAANVALFAACDEDSGGAPPLVEVPVDDSIRGGCNDPDARLARATFARKVERLDEAADFLRIEGEHPDAWASFDRAYDQRVVRLLVIPLTTAEGRTQGALMVTFGEAAGSPTLDEDGLEPVHLMAAQAGAALIHVKLLDTMRKLFEGVIDLTVDAIDEKSAYTGDHCRRVPILAEMISDAVCDDTVGRFKNFSFTEDERYELKIAALLHDCGKVTTPVHVMDKATKLESIVDRVEFVRLRAEILRRDVEIRVLRGRLAAGDEPEAAAAVATSEIGAAVAFVESCNVGGEFMSDEARARVDEIRAEYTWQDSCGTSHGLIDDSEATNLKIGRGTLNDEEREIINSHVVTTMRLLQRLPFPESMRNVPAIAGAHHERVDGTGYPLGLGGEELNLQGRILGLADIFEALTAKDRPYKPGKTLSETLRILASMAAEGHVDSDLHRLFVRERLYLRYAVDHMAPEQIDGAHRAEFERFTAPWRDAARPVST